MTNLKLAKLPDRTPTRITITVSADLNQALCDYQKLYAATYGASEKIADLIPSCSKPSSTAIALSPRRGRRGCQKSRMINPLAAPAHPAQPMQVAKQNPHRP